MMSHQNTHRKLRKYMGAILEEGIGFGGNESQNSNKNYKSTFDVKTINGVSIPREVRTYDENSVVNTTSDDIDGIIEELESEMGLTPVVKRNNTVRPKQKPYFDVPPIEDYNPTQREVDEHIKEVSELRKIPTNSDTVPNIPDPKFAYPASKELNPKSLEESKKLLNSFRNKMKAYPKYLSRKASEILYSILSSNKSIKYTFSLLPDEDQNILCAAIEKDKTEYIKSNGLVNVEMDDSFDFVFTFHLITKDGLENKVVTIFNSLIHPNPTPTNTDIPIEDSGDNNISIAGGLLKLNKDNIQRMSGINKQSPTSYPFEESPLASKKQPQSGKNAFEIRSDVLKNALDYHNNHKINSGIVTEDMVLATAKKFYQFVENKNYR